MHLAIVPLPLCCAGPTAGLPLSGSRRAERPLLAAMFCCPLVRRRPAGHPPSPAETATQGDPALRRVRAEGTRVLIVARQQALYEVSCTFLFPFRRRRAWAVERGCCVRVCARPPQMGLCHSVTTASLCPQFAPSQETDAFPLRLLQRRCLLAGLEGACASPPHTSSLQAPVNFALALASPRLAIEPSYVSRTYELASALSPPPGRSHASRRLLVSSAHSPI